MQPTSCSTFWTLEIESRDRPDMRKAPDTQTKRSVTILQIIFNVVRSGVVVVVVVRKIGAINDSLRFHVA